MLSKEAIEYLMEQGIDPFDRLVEFEDALGNKRTVFVDGAGQVVEIEPKLNYVKHTLTVSTLSSFVDYLKTRDRYYSRTYIHVEDEKTVSVLSDLDQFGKRECLITAVAIVPHFEYEHFHNSEELIVALQSKFTQTEDRDLLLKVIGNVKEENVRETGDDGISQAVTIKTGIASADDVKVPNPVTLAPYRTFLEVEQPTSDFVFRMKDGPRAALFEADGGAWRHSAIQNVKEFLERELEDEIKSQNFIIIA